MYLEIKETFLHFTLIGDHLFVLRLCRSTKFDVAMSFKVELGEAANVASSIHMDREFPEKINDGRSTGK